MLVQSLLEGSERLFHATEVKRIDGILSAGGLLTSQLMSSEQEVRIVRNAGKREKMYYLSFARNLSNEYIRSNLDYDKVVTFEFDSRSLAKYGKVVPVNFFGWGHARGEMEDRLITDWHMIPLSAVKHIRCVVGDENEAIHKKLVDLGIPISFYYNIQDLMANKHPKTFQQCYGGAGKSAQQGVIVKSKEDVTEMIVVEAKLFHEYLAHDGDSYDRSDPFFEKLFEHHRFVDVVKHRLYALNKTLWMFRIADPEMGHNIMLLLRKRGMDTAHDRLSRFYLIWETISGGGEDEDS